jgi:hypothetical protein
MRRKIVETWDIDITAKRKTPRNPYVNISRKRASSNRGGKRDAEEEAYE